jgi:Acetoacetate decarboxylase (ADC)
MLVGTADLATLARRAATLHTYRREPVELSGVDCFQLTAEMRRSAREAVLPPALHPTSPASLSIQIWNVGDGTWGPFALAFCRVSCRSGVRARGFTTAAIATTPQSVDGLAQVLGFPCRIGGVRMRRSYDGVSINVGEAGREILGITGLDPDPMSVDDVQYTGTMNLAHTPNGLRLVQVEAEHVATRVERLTGRIQTFDGAAWGNPLLVPYRVISASIAVENVTVPPIRFVCRPDELAFTGTEAIG